MKNTTRAGSGSAVAVPGLAPFDMLHRVLDRSEIAAYLDRMEDGGDDYAREQCYADAGATGHGGNRVMHELAGVSHAACLLAAQAHVLGIHALGDVDYQQVGMDVALYRNTGAEERNHEQQQRRAKQRHFTALLDGGTECAQLVFRIGKRHHGSAFNHKCGRFEPEGAQPGCERNRP